MSPTSNTKSTKGNPDRRSHKKTTHKATQPRPTRTPLGDHDTNLDRTLHDVSIQELEAELASRQSNLQPPTASAPTMRPAHPASRPSLRPTAHASPAQLAPPTLPVPETYGRPKRASKVSMKQIKAQLGYDAKWNALRDFIRCALASARLNWHLGWKAQRPDKIAMVYNAIEEAFPETARFTGQWGVDRITKQCWDNRKNYRSCVNNPATYRGREAVARRDARAAAVATAAASPAPSPPPSPFPASRSRSGSGSRSPSAGPSQPRRVPRVDDSEDEDESSHDALAPFSDAEGDVNHDGDGEEEADEPRLSAKAAGKRRASSQGHMPSKRHRT